MSAAPAEPVQTDSVITPSLENENQASQPGAKESPGLQSPSKKRSRASAGGGISGTSRSPKRRRLSKVHTATSSGKYLCIPSKLDDTESWSSLLSYVDDVVTRGVISEAKGRELRKLMRYKDQTLQTLYNSLNAPIQEPQLLLLFSLTLERQQILHAVQHQADTQPSESLAKTVKVPSLHDIMQQLSQLDSFYGQDSPAVHQASPAVQPPFSSQAFHQLQNRRNSMMSDDGLFSPNVGGMNPPMRDGQLVYNEYNENQLYELLMNELGKTPDPHSHLESPAPSMLNPMESPLIEGGDAGFLHLFQMMGMDTPVPSDSLVHSDEQNSFLSNAIFMDMHHHRMQDMGSVGRMMQAQQGVMLSLFDTDNSNPHAMEDSLSSFSTESDHAASSFYRTASTSSPGSGYSSTPLSLVPTEDDDDSNSIETDLRQYTFPPAPGQILEEQEREQTLLEGQMWHDIDELLEWNGRMDHMETAETESL